MIGTITPPFSSRLYTTKNDYKLAYIILTYLFTACQDRIVYILKGDVDMQPGIKISKKTFRIIKENLSFAIIVKILVLVLSTLGILGMASAVFADVGVTLITIFNTLRILK